MDDGLNLEGFLIGFFLGFAGPLKPLPGRPTFIGIGGWPLVAYPPIRMDTPPIGG